MADASERMGPVPKAIEVNPATHSLRVSMHGRIDPATIAFRHERHFNFAWVIARLQRRMRPSCHGIPWPAYEKERAAPEYATWALPVSHVSMYDTWKSFFNTWERQRGSNKPTAQSYLTVSGGALNSAQQRALVRNVFFAQKREGIAYFRLGNPSTEVEAPGESAGRTAPNADEARGASSIESGYPRGDASLAKARTWWAARTDDEVRRLVGRAATALGNVSLGRFLRWLYPNRDLLRVAESTYPVAVFPTSPLHWNDVERALMRPLMKASPSDDGLFILDALPRALAERVARPPTDRPTFAMTALRLDAGSPVVDCALGSYFRAMDSCDSLEWELLSTLGPDELASSADFETLLAKLPLRRLLHDRVRDPVMDATGRSAAVAISTLIAFRDGDRIGLLVRKRASRGVSVHAGLFHVIPSFMFQPATVALDEEFSVRHNVLREYLEELFNYPEPEEAPGEPRYFYRHPVLESLRETKAHLLFTGACVNLLNLRPELTTLIWIDDPSWYRRHAEHPAASERFHYNIEWMRLEDVLAEQGQTVGWIPYEANEQRLLRSGQLYPGRVVPPGAAALWLGHRVLTSLLAAPRDDLPRVE